ncbi:MAG: DUF998 domain-containing protein [Roseiflexaceae bacterium]
MNNSTASTSSIDSARTIRRGAFVWILAIQFFIAQVIVQAAWTTPFSLTANYISDLGNTTCGPYPVGSNMYVCSPWHAWMNASFIVQGVIILVGIALLYHAFPAGRTRAIGLVLLALAGPGSILVGLFPENVSAIPHAIGAAAHFVSGNLGIAVLGVAIAADRRKLPLAVFSIISGSLGLLATALFISGTYLGTGIGGMERIAAYPLPLWLIVVGYSASRGCTEMHQDARRT